MKLNTTFMELFLPPCTRRHSNKNKNLKHSITKNKIFIIKVFLNKLCTMYYHCTVALPINNYQ